MAANFLKNKSGHKRLKSAVPFSRQKALQSKGMVAYNEYIKWSIINNFLVKMESRYQKLDDECPNSAYLRLTLGRTPRFFEDKSTQQAEFLEQRRAKI